jgi:hypothetical protein
MTLWNCYIDESGDARALATPTAANVAPAYVIAAIALPEDQLRDLTLDFLQLKRRFFPGLDPGTGQFLDWMLPEVKGADLRRAISSRGSRNQRRHAQRFLADLLTLVESRDGKIFGRIWIKQVGASPNGKAIYTSSVQSIAKTFQRLLELKDASGYLIADSILPAANALVSHSIFTQKLSAIGDAYPRIREAPLFAHSQNHAGIQIADLTCSALLFPMATTRYCLGTVTNVHVDAVYEPHVCQRFGARVKRLQYRYWDGPRRRGGLIVDDRLMARSGAALFR